MIERHEQRIEALRLSGEPLEDTEYAECAFSACEFSDVVMHNIKFVNCTFDDCVLRTVSFRECSMLRVELRNCALVGLDWSAVRRHGARLAPLAAMRACTVKYNTFIDMGITKMDFTGSALLDCYFQDCDLRQATLRECDLQNTVFQHCDLSRADFRDARNYAVNVMNNKVAKARFSLPDAIGLLSGFDVVVE